MLAILYLRGTSSQRKLVSFGNVAAYLGLTDYLLDLLYQGIILRVFSLKYGRTNLLFLLSLNGCLGSDPTED